MTEEFKVVLCTNSTQVLESELGQILQTQNQELEEQKIQRQVESFSEWALNINPKSQDFGKSSKVDFAFVPFISYSATFATLNEVLGLEASNPDVIIPKLTDKYENLGLEFAILEEKDLKLYILINSQAPGEEGDRDPIECIKSVLELTGNFLESNYCKYFVNNCLIIDGGEAFGGDNSKQNEARSLLNKFISDKIAEEKIKKSGWEHYEDSFDFRPFFGDGVLKLPEKKEGTLDQWDWDHIYINPGLDSEKFKTKEELEKAKGGDPGEEDAGKGEAKDEGGHAVQTSVGVGTTTEEIKEN